MIDYNLSFNFKSINLINIFNFKFFLGLLNGSAYKFFISFKEFIRLISIDLISVFSIYNFHILNFIPFFGIIKIFVRLGLGKSGKFIKLSKIIPLVGRSGRWVFYFYRPSSIITWVILVLEEIILRGFSIYLDVFNYYKNTLNLSVMYFIRFVVIYCVALTISKKYRVEQDSLKKVFSKWGKSFKISLSKKMFVILKGNSFLIRQKACVSSNMWVSILNRILC